MRNELYDVVIIGGGAAGLTAAMYARRKQLKTAIISKEIGGATALSNWVENYPGTKPMPGLELMEQFKATAVSLGTEVIAASVTAITPGDGFALALSLGTPVQGKTIIVTAGKIPRRLRVPGEDKFFGRGVSTCATCDGPLFKGKTVAVVGGGNAAVEAALELAELASKTYLIHRRQAFRADEITVAKLRATAVTILLDRQITAVKGERNVTAITVRDGRGQTSDVAVDGLFLEIGSDTDPAIVAPFAHNPADEILVDDRQRTNVRGAFAAGDVTNVAYKQTVISAGDGATAALEAHRFLTSPTYQWPTSVGR